MSETNHNDRAITEYLLGLLPPAEAERYDELSIASEEFAATVNACEKDLVDAYVQGELAAPQRARFRSHYLASPLRREKLAFAEAFQLLPTRRASALTDNDKSDAKIRRSWLVSLTTYLSPRPALQWGLAAGLLLLFVAGGWFAIQNLRLRSQMSQAQARRDELEQREQILRQQLEAQQSANSKTEQELAQVRAGRERLDHELKPANAQQPASILSFILAPGLRGAGQPQSVSIPPRVTRVAMQLKLEPNDYQAYSVALIDQSTHQTLWHSGRLNAHSDRNGKTISVSFSADLLKAQIYSLQVSGVSANGATEMMSDYPFKVVK